jgi:hypothetical protein
MFLASVALPFSSSRAAGGLASLGDSGIGSFSQRSFEKGVGSMFPESRMERQDPQLMLGYQLGLQAAARAARSGMTSNVSRGFSEDAVSARLEALRQRVPPVRNFDRADTFTTSEFGLPYSEIKNVFDEMKRRG